MSLERIKYLMYKDLNLLKEDMEFPDVNHNLFNLRGERPNSTRNVNGDKIMSGKKAGDIDGHIMGMDKRFNDGMDKFFRDKGVIQGNGGENGTMFNGLECDNVPNQAAAVSFFNCLAVVETVTNGNKKVVHKDIEISKGKIYIKLIKDNTDSNGVTTYHSESKEIIMTFDQTCKLTSIKLDYMDHLFRTSKHSLYTALKTEECYKLIKSLDETTNLITFK